ncbi:hypothetical protein GCM10009578_065780 [Streptomyces rhizosphaericus]|uniref:hypothetical protein n=1 Tax=Streptomyces rhizosphaericus TaxID=114699 RepID=UPI000A37A3C2
MSAVIPAYDALPPYEQSLVRQLGCHPGTHFTRLQACALSGMPTEAVTVDAALINMLEARLIRRTADGHFAFYDDTVRTHAHQLADAAGRETEPAERRLYEHYLLSAAEAARLLGSGRNRLQRRYKSPGPIVGECFDGHEMAWNWMLGEQTALRNGLRRTALVYPDLHWQLVDELWVLWQRQPDHQWAMEAHHTGLQAARACGDQAGIVRILTSYSVIAHPIDPELGDDLLRQVREHGTRIGEDTLPRSGCSTSSTTPLSPSEGRRHASA